MLGMVEIIDWLRSHYDKDYKRNTRETIRRQTRRRQMIPVTLLDGTPVELTPGGQNVLLKQMVEECCPAVHPRGHDPLHRRCRQ
jgi:hypothetical protein